jgi:hypothetical protein
MSTPLSLPAGHSSTLNPAGGLYRTLIVNQAQLLHALREYETFSNMSLDLPGRHFRHLQRRESNIFKKLLSQASRQVNRFMAVQRCGSFTIPVELPCK